MKIANLTFLLMFALTCAAVAADKNPASLTVAVYDFTDVDKNGDVYGSKVTALVTANLTAEENLVMLERSDLKKALGEQAIGVAGLVTSETAARIGQFTGAKVLVSGQVIKTEKNRLFIVASIVGTETGRLFAEKVEGAAEKFADLTSDLSKNIARNIHHHAASLVNEPVSHEEILQRILKSVKGANRPSVSVDFHSPHERSVSIPSADNEMMIILQKAGFTVLDSNADHKPDITITGIADSDMAPEQGGLHSVRTVVEAKVLERLTGKIIVIDRETGDAVDIGNMTAQRTSQARAVDAIAEKVLPLLAQ